MRSKLVTDQANLGSLPQGERINGVDVAAVGTTIGAIRAHPAEGRFRFRAHNRWLDGGRTRTTVRNYYGAGGEQTDRARPFVIDSETPAVFRRADRAMDPLEHLLAAVASCMTTTLVWQASIRGLHLDAVETNVEGDIDFSGSLGIDDSVTPGYRSLRITVTLESDASDVVLDDLVHTAMRLSPVLNTIGAATAITMSWKPGASAPLQDVAT